MAGTASDGRTFMHGMIARALKEMVMESDGEARWIATWQRAGLEALARCTLAGLAERWGEQFDIERPEGDPARPGHRARFVMRRA